MLDVTEISFYIFGITVLFRLWLFLFDLECQCNKHGLSCAYNDTLGHGICTRCQHNTEGQHCEKCRPMYYRDSSVPIDHPNTCVGKRIRLMISI